MMLYILVEGNDDERFMNRIVIPELKCERNSVQIFKYRNHRNKKVTSLVKSITRMGDKYIFIGDYNKCVCYSQVKLRIKRKYKIIDEKLSFVAKMEIESWYCAGLSDAEQNKYKIRKRNTENINKEEFNRCVSRAGYDSRIQYMSDLLENYKIEVAKKKNNSFKYFIDKIGIFICKI